MIERKFKSLPLYMHYRCGNCKESFEATELPENCPHCSAIIKEVGYNCVQDEI